MSRRTTGTKKRKHLFLKILAAIAIVIACAVLAVLSHPQIIVGTIQKRSASQVNTSNSFEPLNEPVQAVRENGQYIITEIRYDDEYPNSFLDITYPDENLEADRPTLFYFHGGGFFGGSKSVGDPLAESDVTSLLDDICAAGFNLVNVDYALVPDYHFPVPLIQANRAFAYIQDHAEEYHINMDNIVIMGSSAGAIITSQMGSIVTNPEYAEALGIDPVLKPNQLKAVVIDDAPLVYDQFSVGTKILVGNYMKGSIFLTKDEIKKYDNILWVNPDYPPAVLLGSEYYVDMRALNDALTQAEVTHELIDPLAERNLQMPHCFVASERIDDVARDAFDRMMLFIKTQVQ